MEIDRRLFCKLLLYSPAFLLTGYFRPLLSFPPDASDTSIAGSINTYPGKVIPLDKRTIREIGKWAG